MALTKVKINLGTEGNLSGSRSIIQSTKTLVSSSAQLATDISGSFTAASSSFSTRVTTMEGSGTAQGVGTSDSPTFNNITATGTVTAQEFHSEFVSASITYTSGSHKFGDTSDDIQSMTGSLNISGSLGINDGNVHIVDKMIVGSGSSFDFDNTNHSFTVKSSGNNSGFSVLSSAGGELLRFIQESNDAGKLDIYDGGSLKVRLSAHANENSYINSGGNFGIDETSPDGKLHVKQSTDDGNAIVVDSGTDGGRIDVLTVQEAGNERWNLSFEGSGATNDLTFNSNTTSSILNIKPGGNVGIGTGSPKEKLEVDGHIANYRLYSRTGIVNGALSFNSYYNGSAWVHDDNSKVSMNMYMSDTRDNLEFAVRDGGASDGFGSTHLAIGGDGNVGIGTTGPGATLHVDDNSSTAYNGAAEVGETVIFRNKNGSDDSGVNNVVSIGLQVADGATSQGFINYVRTGNNTGEFTFSQRTASSTYAEHMRIDNSGNVGIGTNNPGTNLHLYTNTSAHTTLKIEADTNNQRADINLDGRTTSDQSFAEIVALNNGDSVGAIAFNRDGANDAGNITFTTQVASGAMTERMRIASTGNVGIGLSNSSVNNKFQVQVGTDHRIGFWGGSSYSAIQSVNDANSAQQDLRFDASAYYFYSGKIGIGDDAPEGWLTINQGTNDDKILSLKTTGDLAHGVTDYGETDTFGYMKKFSNTQGGLVIGGMSTHERPIVLQAFGNYYQSAGAGTGTDKCAVQIFAYENSGTGITNVGSNESIFAVRGQKGGSMQSVFIVDIEGDLHTDGSTSLAGYDYAEYFEWTDGNPDNEDRVGYSVVLEGDKIRKATEGETPIGIISGVPAVVGDNPMGWQGTWKTDEWGRKINKEVEFVRWEYDYQSEEGAEVVKQEQNWKVSDLPEDLEIPDNAKYYTKLESQYSDDYDSSQSYTLREYRQEWSAVGLMGKLRLRKGQPVASTWIKMRDEGNNIEMWLVK